MIKIARSWYCTRCGDGKALQDDETPPDTCPAAMCPVALEPRKLAKAIADWDWKHNSDSLYLEFGGDGDNGEFLIEALTAVLNQENDDE